MDVVDSRENNWLVHSFSSGTTDTPTTSVGVVMADASLSVTTSKLPLMATKSAPDSLVVKPAAVDVISSTSTSDAVSSGSVVDADGRQKPVTELSTARPAKCKYVGLHLVYMPAL